MSRKLASCIVSCIIGLGAFPAVLAAADYAGNYEDTHRTVIVKREGTGYVGEIRIGEQSYPLAGHEEGDHLAGTFTSAGNVYAFVATQQGDDLIVVSEGKTFQLHRHINANPLAPGQPVNPLGAGGGAPAADRSPQSADPFADYIVITKTDTGRSLVREIPTAKTTLAALQATYPDLARYFGARPTILGAYEDGRDHKSAFVSFSAKANDQAIKGFITTRLHDEGAVVFLVFGRADASHEEWAKLTARPTLSSGERDLKTEMALVPIKPYTFRDNTGAIGLAEGWTTNAVTESNLLITGPADQKIRMAFGGQLYTPDSDTVRRNRNGALNLVVAPYSDDPAKALGNIIRANSAASGRTGGPTVVPERIIKVVPVKARNPGGHAAQITYDQTITTKGASRRYRVLIQFEVSPLTRMGTWGYYTFLQLMSPPESYDQDLPVMLAQSFSLAENADVIMAKSQKEMDAARKLAEAQRKAADEIAKAHYQHNKDVADASARQSKAWRDDEINDAIKHRSITDFDETIRGIRTVEDTQTGEKTSVNLGDVHQIVDNLNYHDPGRYREIPLRDEMFPLAGHENDRDYLGR
jgi:hypothetical protein